MDNPDIQKNDNTNGVKAWQLWILALLIILFIFTMALIFYVLITKNISSNKNLYHKNTINTHKN